MHAAVSTTGEDPAAGGARLPDRPRRGSRRQPDRYVYSFAVGHAVVRVPEQDLTPTCPGWPRWCSTTSERPGFVEDAVHLVLRGLGARADHQLVDVHVRRPGDHPADRVGDVLGDQQLGDTGVDRVVLLLVAAEPLSENSSVFTMPGAISLTRTGWS